MGRWRESAWKPSWCYWTCQCAPPTPHTNVQIRASWSWWGGGDGKFSSNSLCLHSQFSWKLLWSLWYISVASRVHNLLLSSWKFPLGKSQIHNCEFIQQCLVNSPHILSWWNSLRNTYIFATALVDLSSWETQDSPKSAGHHFQNIEHQLPFWF